MPISLDNLPTNNDGGIEGSWTIQLRQNLNGGHAGLEWRDGRSVTPVDGNGLRRLVATLGPDIVGAYRSADHTALGDVSTLRPETFDEAHSKSLTAQSSNKLREEASVVAEIGQENAHTDALHAATGAKFISPEEAERRKDFEKASGREAKDTGGAVATDSEDGTGGLKRTGAEPIDPAALKDGDPLKPVPTGDDQKVGEVSVTVDTGKTKETFKGDVKTPHEVSPTHSASSTTSASTSTKSSSSELKPGTDKSKK